MKITNASPEFEGRFRHQRTRTDALIVHHAAALYPTNAGIEDVRAVARYHLSKGYAGIGYHEALAESVNGGPIECFTLSDPGLRRAHIAHVNDQYFGIACLTNFEKHPGGVPEQKWFTALVERLRYWKTIYPLAAIAGHKERALPGYATACPGTNWLDWKDRLLKQVAQPALSYYIALGNGLAIRDQPGIQGDVMYRVNAGHKLLVDWENPRGTAVQGPNGVTSRTWLHLYAGGYVAKVYTAKA